MQKKGIDLPTETLTQLAAIFSTCREIERVIIFGSRALGNAKPGSDIDLAFSGKNVTSHLVSRVQDYLEEETTLPYFFDCIHLEAIQNRDLVGHIREYGKVLYERLDDR